ncbi:MAG: FAD/NAD(P)-binding protein [Thermoanaerobaculia bacterium]
MRDAVARPSATVPDPMRPVPFRVKRVVAETHDTFTLVLAPPREGPPFSFRPGQFNMLWAYGCGEVPISLSGSPGGADELLHTIRAVGPVTEALHRLGRGDTVGVRGPFGTAWPMDAVAGCDVVLVAGGIGLAPLRPVLHSLLSDRARYGRIVLLVGARTPQDLLFTKELESWRGRFDMDVEVTVDRAARDWYGLVGVVTSLIPRAPFEPGKAAAFVCGPEIMMHFTLLELERRGVARSRLWVSLERNMKCGAGLCGHCQMGPFFVCKDGPVFPWERVASWLSIREV